MSAKRRWDAWIEIRGFFERPLGDSRRVAANQALPVALRALQMRTHQRLRQIAVAGTSAS
jgi:hypothetical protein